MPLTDTLEFLFNYFCDTNVLDSMKKLFILPFLLCCVNLAQAATTIPAGNIGTTTWTLAGSPYNIAGTVNVTGTLNIDPGVEVVFQGFYQMKITGLIKANGTAAQRIIFRAQDTTGWYNDIVPTGGWRGIYFDDTNAPLDSTYLKYCVIKDVKHGVNAPQNDNSAIFLYFRNLKLDHCEFVHNQSSANQSVGSIISGSLKPGRTFEMAFCDLHDSYTRVAAIKLDTYLGGFLYIHDNRMHHNRGAGTVFTIWSEMLFENNELDSNSCTFINMGTLRVDGGHNTIRGNKLHHNINERMAAIGCSMGKTIIEKNLICNNQMLDASCGLTDGGAAIHISHNNNGPWDSTEYTIRDNVIANNYANFAGSAIYIYDCKAKIFNNHIIKNKSSSSGVGINAYGLQNQLHIRNNIFYGNESTAYGVKQDVFLAGGSFYTFDYNWIDYPRYEVVSAANVPLNGDTSHNVIGANPMLVNPTTMADPNDNALIKDFHLQGNSLCANAGDVTNITLSPTDFYGNARVSGPKVDIGAHELQDTGVEGINDLADAFPVKIFPNPVYDQLTLTLDSQQPYSCSIFDLSGRLLFTQNSQIGSLILDICQYTPGTYFLSIENMQGQKVIKKIAHQ